MPIIFQSDIQNYIPKRLNKTYSGKALYLPGRKKCDGDGLSDIAKWLTTNKDMITGIAGTAGSVIDAGSKLSSLTLDSISKVKDIRKKSLENEKLEREALDDVLSKRKPIKSGGGFYEIK